jgi:hypothetical protein
METLFDVISVEPKKNNTLLLVLTHKLPQIKN